MTRTHWLLAVAVCTLLAAFLLPLLVPPAPRPLLDIPAPKPAQPVVKLGIGDTVIAPMGPRSGPVMGPAVGTYAPLRLSAGQCAAPDADTGSLTRILRDDDESFPEHVTRLDFDTDEEGAPLPIGTNVEKLFQDRGVSFSTSIATSYVGIDGYVVHGRTQGHSAATVSPRWEGVLTLRFNVPKRPDIPAGVHWLGLWIADVFPHGTRLEALDAAGREIGTIEVRCRMDDFLAFHSETPVASVRVVPNRAIDPNYTIDDVVFDTPRAL
jgi:hypothetical protein